MLSHFSFAALAAATGSLVTVVAAASSSTSSCSTTLTPTNSVRPSIASGYQMALVATGLTTPRSIQFDGSGNLLVVQQGKGIVALEFQDDGGTCLSVKTSTNVVENTALNHGIFLDGNTLYASSSDTAWSWTYDSAKKSVSATNKTIVAGMNTDDHTTRTLLVVNRTLVVTRGSTSNLDVGTEMVSSGRSQVKMFDLSSVTANGYDFNTEGVLLGWGLRNDVGIAAHPATGGLYSVENSADDVERDGQDIHQNNPGEELNYLGTVSAPSGRNYGYPYCFAAWNPSAIPNSNLTVGQQFAIGTPNSTINDTYCAQQEAPRLTFQAHMAPLDIIFNNSGTEAWVSFHGSWDRTNPVGYKVSVLQFAKGEPVAPSNSTTSLTDIFTNADNSRCNAQCFRPVGLALDNQGRLFVSSDSTGEVYVIQRDGTANGGLPSTASGGGGAPAASPTSKQSSAYRHWNYNIYALIAALSAICVIS